MVRPRTPIGQTARLPTVAAFRLFRRDPLGLFAEVASGPDGVARVDLLGRSMVFITDPDHVRYVLKDNHRNYDKNAPIYNAARPFLGEGLTVSHGGEDWLRRRRLVQPAFHRQHLPMAADVTENCLADTLADWRTYPDSGAEVDFSLEMTRLTMRIACRSLFGVDVVGDVAQIARNLDFAAGFVAEFLARPFPPLFVPTRRNREFRRAMRQVRDLTAAIVRSRTGAAEPAGATGLLSPLLTDTEAGGSTPGQVRDELIGLFFAGHETLAHTLTWCWYLLARNPAADARLRTELTSVLGGRPATLADLGALRYTRMVVDEAMRLYPVVWIMMRRALGPDVIAGHRIPAGAVLAWSPYVGNRDPRVWSEPDEFRPERFDPDGNGREAGYSRHSVIPFGLGPRACVGADFATAEACLAVATLAQEYQSVLLGRTPIRPEASLTLHPRDGLPVLLRRRTGHDVAVAP
ncbi:cytochrome P450 [Plantactinospora soyae]|uniref:Cytochrome P450 n=1 Tax=Plantactinospora soyae TaxID=1544732 RepID=A0A927R0M6_9ACTN|nr:cytochrome P450 [Plantactinospora soyae]MBE1491745.1 cytochrome P450 [Plantactinospora soyae]